MSYFSLLIYVRFSAFSLETELTGLDVQIGSSTKQQLIAHSHTVFVGLQKTLRPHSKTKQCPSITYKVYTGSTGRCFPYNPAGSHLHSVDKINVSNYQIQNISDNVRCKNSFYTMCFNVSVYSYEVLIPSLPFLFF